MNDPPFQPTPHSPDPPEDDLWLATARDELRRALRAASPEDRAFVLGRLEEVARRLHGREPT